MCIFPRWDYYFKALQSTSSCITMCKVCQMIFFWKLLIAVCTPLTVLTNIQNWYMKVKQLFLSQFWTYLHRKKCSVLANKSLRAGKKERSVLSLFWESWLKQSNSHCSLNSQWFGMVKYEICRHWWAWGLGERAKEIRARVALFKILGYYENLCNGQSKQCLPWSL